MNTSINVSTIAPRQSNQEIVASLKNLVTASINKDKALRLQIAEISEQLKNALDNIVPYKIADGKVKEATKTRTHEKNTFLRRPEFAKMDAMLKELRAERKEGKEIMGEYLMEYYRLTQLSLFDLEDGRVATIVNNATLKLR